MTLSIVTAVCGRNELTKEWLDTTIARCADVHELVIVSNGSKFDEVEELKNWLLELKEIGWKIELIICRDPIGTTKAFQIGAEQSTGSIIAMLHNDLEVKENNWDRTLINFMGTTIRYGGKFYNNEEWVGVVGFVGAKRLGAYDIYRTPYELKQMARFDVYSSQDDAHNHGIKIVSPVQVAVLDGMALIIKREVFDQVGGFDLKYIHHMYDNDLCISVFKARYINWVIPIEVHHKGGQTSCHKEYGDWLRTLSLTDQMVHQQSHEYFYKKWKNKLPVIARG